VLTQPAADARSKRERIATNGPDFAFLFISEL
jgi:hypothetical protein